MTRRNRRYQQDGRVMPWDVREHGEYAKYVKEKCRCALCTDAARVYRQKRRRVERVLRDMGYTYKPPK